MFNIKPLDLNWVAPKMPPELAISVSDMLNTICPAYGIDSFDILHEFVANLLVESNEFTTLEENMNYAEGTLLKMFRNRISKLEAFTYGRNAHHKADKAAIANIIYGGDWGRKNLGNTMRDDGFRFRGSGPIQITGRRNVTAFTEFYNNKFNTDHTPEQMAELLRTDLRMGIHSACWFFAVAKDLEKLAINDEMRKIVERINGGFNGMDDRQRYYERAKARFV